MTEKQWHAEAIEDGWRPPLHKDVTKEQVSEFIGEEAHLVEDFGKRYWITKSGKVVSTTYGKLKQLKVQTGRGVVYPFCPLGANGNLYLHRVLALMFIPNPDEVTNVNHIDGNKHNYKLENLEWVTPSENSLHAYRLGLRKPSRKTTNV